MDLSGERGGLGPSLSPIVQIYAELKASSSLFSQTEKRLQMD